MHSRFRVMVPRIQDNCLECFQCPRTSAVQVDQLCDLVQSITTQEQVPYHPAELEDKIRSYKLESWIILKAILGGFHTSLVQNRAWFAWKIVNVKRFMQTWECTAVLNQKLPVGGAQLQWKLMTQVTIYLGYNSVHFDRHFWFSLSLYLEMKMLYSLSHILVIWVFHNFSLDLVDTKSQFFSTFSHYF